MNLKLIINDKTFIIELNESVTSKELLKHIPHEAPVHKWGEELYFSVPFECQLDKTAKAEVEVGTVAYWPHGPYLCLFFGPTPVSTNNKPRAYSPVNIAGMINSDLSYLKTIKEGTIVKITK